MLNFLLLLNFILVIIALFSIIILYTRQSKLLNLEKDHQKLIRELDELFSSYMIEMKEENEKFIKILKGLDQDENLVSGEKEKLVKNPNFREDQSSKEQYNENQEHKDIPTVKGNVYQAVQAYKSNSNIHHRQNDMNLDAETNAPITGIDPKKMNGNSKNIRLKDYQGNKFKQDTLLEQIFALQKQGFSHEEIAKKLHKGKTEIELLLKFQENKKE